MGEEAGDRHHGEDGPEEPVGEDLHTMNGSAIFGAAAAEPQLPIAVGRSTGERDGVPFQLDCSAVVIAAFDRIGIDGGCGHDRTDAARDSSGPDGGGVFRPAGSAAGDDGERTFPGYDCAFVFADFGVAGDLVAVWTERYANGGDAVFHGGAIVDIAGLGGGGGVAHGERDDADHVVVDVVVGDDAGRGGGGGVWVWVRVCV